MSTKIYNAYKYNGSIHDLMADLKVIQTQLRKEFVKGIVNDNLTTEVLHFSAPGLWDMFYFMYQQYRGALKEDASEDIFKNTPVYKLDTIYMEDFFSYIKKSYSSSFGCLDLLSASAVIYSHKKKLYVQFFCLPRNFNLLKKFPKLSDFHYQNQSDEPDDVSPRAWKNREKVWDEIFKDSDTPSNAGIPFDFIQINFDLTYEIYTKG